MEQCKELFLFVCDHAFIDKSDKLNIIGIFENISFVSVPSQLLKMVVVGSYKLLDIKNNEVQFEVKILKPDDSVLFSVKNEHAKVGKNGRMNVIFELTNTRFDEFGEYKIVTLIDSVKSGEVIINVNKKSN